MVKMKARGLASSLSRGFTLIELLVVIAIIGILAAIILASLSGARNKGNDAKVQEQLKAIQNAAEEFYSGGNTYTAFTGDAASGAANLMAASSWTGTAGGAAPTAVIKADGSAYAVYHLLSTGSFWCVDSTGVSKSEPSSWTAPTATSPSCP